MLLVEGLLVLLDLQLDLFVLVLVLFGLLVYVLSLLSHLHQLEIGMCCCGTLHGLLRLLLGLSLLGQGCSVHNRIQIVIRTVNLPTLRGRMLGPTLRPLPRVVVPRLPRLALGSPHQLR